MTEYQSIFKNNQAEAAYMAAYDRALEKLPVPYETKYGDHISVNSIQQALRRLAGKVGLPGCHPHLFRHTFATMFIASNGSPPILKEIMGHRSFQTTEKYIHPKAEDLKIQHQIHSPITEIFKQD